MDHELKVLISSTASDLLSRSTQFEPYIPNSNQNLYHGLKLLTQLGKITEDSLKTFLNSEVQAAKKPETAKQVPKLEINRTAQASMSNPKRSREVDEVLTQALQKMRESKLYQRKTPGVFSSIQPGGDPKSSL
jgi:hypothetical protein